MRVGFWLSKEKTTTDEFFVLNCMSSISQTKLVILLCVCKVLFHDQSCKIFVFGSLHHFTCRVAFEWKQSLAVWIWMNWKTRVWNVQHAIELVLVWSFLKRLPDKKETPRETTHRRYTKDAALSDVCRTLHKIVPPHPTIRVCFLFILELEIVEKKDWSGSVGKTDEPVVLTNAASRDSNLLSSARL